MTHEHVGCIGLGSMGGSMALRLLEVGHPVTVHDLSADAVGQLANAGAQVAQSPVDVANRCAVVIACLPSPQASHAVAYGEQGACFGSKVEVYVETSTLGRPTIERIAKEFAVRNIGFLDCPISGARPRAREGTLALMISGAKESYERASTVLDGLGKRFYLAPSPGLSQVAKLINNHISAAGRVATFEGLAMGIKAGIDPKVLNDLFNASSARNFTTTDMVPAAILSGTFSFSAPLSVGLKDEGLFLEEAERCDAGTWLGQRILALFGEAAQSGLLHEDSMRLFQFIQSSSTKDR